MKLNFSLIIKSLTNSSPPGAWVCMLGCLAGDSVERPESVYGLIGGFGIFLDSCCWYAGEGTSLTQRQHLFHTRSFLITFFECPF